MKKRIFFIVSAVLVTLFIFGNSFKDAESSTESSKIFTNAISNTLSRADKTVDSFTVTYFVRKTAHLMEFALQGFLIAGCFSEKFKKRTLYVLLLGLLTAFTDEFIQHFSKGRAPMIRDVGLDFIGTILGLFVFFFAVKLLQKRKA